MQEQPVILVQVNDPQWTWEALRNACAWAQQSSGCIALVQMVRVQHIAYLGTPLGYTTSEAQQLENLQKYVDLVASCGLDCEVQVYQCYDSFRAIVDMATQVGASVVFARLPRSIIPFWSECRFEVLRQRLAHLDVELYDRPVNKLMRNAMPLWNEWNDLAGHLPSQA